MKKVSVLMPCFNEERFLTSAVESLVDDYVMEFAEILVIDGMSTDNTIASARELQKKNYPIRILENGKRLQCYGLNQGINEAEGDIIVRVDAHSIYPEGYVKNLVNLLETTGAANVGGIMLPKGKNTVQKAVAMAMRHPVGVGDAKFHLGNFKGYVDTVYLGTFRKDIFRNVGLYDTNCRTNEDAELNIRILKQNEKIYLDSSIAVEYLPRDTFSKLAIQYFRYGMGRAYTTTKHKQVTSLRQLAAPALVTGLIGTAILTVIHPLFFLSWTMYLLAVFAVALLTPPEPKTPVKLRLALGVAFIVMHVTWGMGFLGFFLKKITGKAPKITGKIELNN